MIAEIGQIALALGFLTALYQGIFPLIGSARGDHHVAQQAARAAVVQAALIFVAFSILTVLHVTSDFSVRNVAENSHSAKPFIYKISGVWGNHEGSMLLWILILAGFGAGLGLRQREFSALTTRTLAIQAWIAAAFLAFVIFTSNPFTRLTPVPADGFDLNPLLQDPGLAIHPPFLYLGYVGFSIVFSFAIAGLIGGRIDQTWARAVRPWAVLSWVFLTLGIGLGSWWAYHELGWGGFWAWDPVENASFMPWLAGTALIHSIRVLEVRGAFKAWTALLAIMTFSLSLVGTFLVRSGILTSVHAFAVDPTRGVFILAILGAFVGGSLVLFAMRGPSLTSNAQFNLVSREGGLLFNNVVMVIFCAIVFIGTFYPLFVEVMSGEKISVGAPYFNLVLPFFALPLLFLLAPGGSIAWKRSNISVAMKRLWPALIAAIAALFITAWISSPKTMAAIAGAALAVWTFSAAVTDFTRRARVFSGEASGVLDRMVKLPRFYLGMTVAHMGVAVVALGVIGAGAWKSDVIAYANIGDVLVVGNYDVTFMDVSRAEGPNYITDKAIFSVGKKGTTKSLIAERRFYPVRGTQTTESAVYGTIFGDVYITIGEQQPEKGWVVRGYYYPFAKLMWIGGIFMALGGLIALLPKNDAMSRRKKGPMEEGTA